MTSALGKRQRHFFTMESYLNHQDLLVSDSENYLKISSSFENIFHYCCHEVQLAFDILLVFQNDVHNYWTSESYYEFSWLQGVTVFCSPNLPNLFQKSFTPSALRCKRLLGSGTRRYWAPLLGTTLASGRSPDRYQLNLGTS